MTCFPVALAVMNKGGFKFSIPQGAIEKKLWAAVLPAFKLRFNDDMLRHLSCSTPSYEGEEVKIVVSALDRSCKGPQALAQMVVDWCSEMVPSRQFACKVMCLEGTFSAISVAPALQGA